MTITSLDFFQNLFEKNQTTELSSLQVPYWEKFSTRGAPSKKDEALQYFPFLRFQEYCKLEKKESIRNRVDFSSSPEENCFVFENGVYSPERSSLDAIDKKIIVLTLEQALKSSYGSILQHRWKMSLEQEEDPFALLNGACCRSGLFIYVPPRVQLKTPLKVLFLQTDSHFLFNSPRVHLFVGTDSEVQLISITEGKSISNSLIDIAIEERASVFYTSYTGKHKEEFGFSSFRASLKKEGLLQSMTCMLGTNCRREDYKISLLGERARAELTGLCGTKKNNQSHVYVQMEHLAPSCHSEQLFKQVLLGHSRASFTGKIHVTRPAQKTEAYQLCRSLLLSDQAIAYAKPNLEIFADDVKASHGATIAQINEEEKFYLQSRGISAEEAAVLLTQGFCQEVLDKISSNSLQNLIQEKYRDFLKEEGENA